MKHHFWMLIACLLPLVLLFALPAFGIRSDGIFTLFIVVCFVMHLLMMRGHGHGKGGHKGDGDGDEHRFADGSMADPSGTPVERRSAEGSASEKRRRR